MINGKDQKSGLQEIAEHHSPHIAGQPDRRNQPENESDPDSDTDDRVEQVDPCLSQTINDAGQAGGKVDKGTEQGELEQQFTGSLTPEQEVTCPSAQQKQEYRGSGSDQKTKTDAFLYDIPQGA